MKIAVGTTFQRIHAHSLLRQLVQLPIAFTAVVEGGGLTAGYGTRKFARDSLLD